MNILPPNFSQNDDNNVLFYDLFLNACYSKNLDEELYNVVKVLKENGATDRQIEQFRGRAIGQGLNVPKLIEKPHIISIKDYPKVNIEPDPKFAKISTDAMYQNVRDKFGLFIYDKKFNNSQYGCFGMAQNIVPESKQKCIILHIPEDHKQILSRDQKLLNSVRHYKNKGQGIVTLKFIP